MELADIYYVEDGDIGAASQIVALRGDALRSSGGTPSDLLPGSLPADGTRWEGGCSSPVGKLGDASHAAAFASGGEGDEDGSGDLLSMADSVEEKREEGRHSQRSSTSSSSSGGSVGGFGGSIALEASSAPLRRGRAGSLPPTKALRVMGITERDLHVSKALRVMGAASSPHIPTPARGRRRTASVGMPLGSASAAKAARLLGTSQAQLQRHKALDTLGVTEAELTTTRLAEGSVGALKKERDEERRVSAALAEQLQREKEIYEHSMATVAEACASLAAAMERSIARGDELPPDLSSAIDTTHQLLLQAVRDEGGPKGRRKRLLTEERLLRARESGLDSGAAIDVRPLSSVIGMPCSVCPCAAFKPRLLRRSKCRHCSHAASLHV